MGRSLYVAPLASDSPAYVRRADGDLRLRADSRVLDFSFSPDGRFLFFRVSYEDDADGRRRPVLLWSIDLTDPAARLREVSRVELIPTDASPADDPRFGTIDYLVTDDSREVVVATDKRGPMNSYRLYRHDLFGSVLSTPLTAVPGRVSAEDRFSGNVELAGFTDGGRGIVFFAQFDDVLSLGVWQTIPGRPVVHAGMPPGRSRTW